MVTTCHSGGKGGSVNCDHEGTWVLMQSRVQKVEVRKSNAGLVGSDPHLLQKRRSPTAGQCSASFSPCLTPKQGELCFHSPRGRRYNTESLLGAGMVSHCCLWKSDDLCPIVMEIAERWLQQPSKPERELATSPWHFQSNLLHFHC